MADGARNYVADVADLCQKLGADYRWDSETRTATATYRGVTITLTAGSATALVDGEAMELYTDYTLEDGTEQRVELPVLEEDGTVSALITAFTQSWSLDAEVDEKLYPFEIGLLRYPVLDVGERNYVADVADLCQKLGADYR